MRAGTPFEPGDYVQLTDPKGKHYTFVLAAGKQFHTHKGVIEHDDLLGGPEGVVVAAPPAVSRSSPSSHYSVTLCCRCHGARPSFIPRMPPRSCTTSTSIRARVSSKLASGSGALTCSLLRAVGDSGEVWSFERRPDFAEVARVNVESFFGAPQPGWHLHPADLVASLNDDLVQTPDDCRPSRARHARSLGVPGRFGGPHVGGGGHRHLRRHHDPAVPHRGGAAGAHRVHRATIHRDDRAALARRRASGAARSSNGRATPDSS